MSRADVLVSADWAEENLNTPGVVFVEVDEDTSAYDGGHIAGAVKLDWKTELQDQVRRDFVSKEQFEAAAVGEGHRQRRHRRALRRQQQLVRRLRLLVLQALRPRRRQAARRRPQEVGARRPRAVQGHRRRDRTTLPGQGPGHLDPRVPRRGRRRDRQAEPRRRPLARRVLRQAARAGAPAAGAVPARRAHPDRAQRAVEQGGERGRHVQVRRRARASSTATRVWTTAGTPSPTAASASARATPGSRCTSCSATRTSRTTTARGPSTARWSASRSRRTSDMCGAPAQTPTLPAGVDLEKETVIYGVVSHRTTRRCPAPTCGCSTAPVSSPPRSSPRRPATSGSSPRPATGRCRCCTRTARSASERARGRPRAAEVPSTSSNRSPLASPASGTRHGAGNRATRASCQLRVRSRSVDEGLDVLREDLVDEAGRSGDPCAATRSSGPSSRRAAHCVQTVREPPARTASRRSASGAECGSSNASARPGTASQTASPVSHSETSAPAASAVAATVNAWEQRSGASEPEVHFTTRRGGRVMGPSCCSVARVETAYLVLLIATFVAIAAVAAYVLVEAVRRLTR